MAHPCLLLCSHASHYVATPDLSTPLTLEWWCRYEEALAFHQQAIVLSPLNPATYSAIGRNRRTWWKIAIYLSLGLSKGRPSYRRSLQLSKENIQQFKTWNFFTFFLFVGHFCPSWIRIRIQQLKVMRIRVRIRIRICNPPFEAKPINTVADGCLSQFRIFFHPGSAPKNLSIFNPKNCF